MQIGGVARYCSPRPRSEVCQVVEYVPRIADDQLVDRLGALGAVVMEGPKACGKTATARRCAVSEVLLDVDVEAARAVAVDPRLILDGPVPRSDSRRRP